MFFLLPSFQREESLATFCMIIVKKAMKRHNALGTAVGAVVAVLHPQDLIKYSFCNRQ